MQTCLPWNSRDLLENLAQLKPAVVYFLGGNDTGKTTLITWVANQLLGTSLAILDTDIGQSSVLPLTISLLRAERPFSSFSELPTVEQEFIPGYNLVRNLERNARTMGELAREARSWAQYCLVDTTGFVGGPGIHLKRREIEEVQPDLIVALHRSDELRPILKDLKCHLLLFPVPSWMGKKSEAERRKRRNQKLSSYFQGSNLREIPAKAVACIPLDHKERIVGLYGERFLGLGVVRGVRDEKLLVLTPVKGDLQRVEFTPVKFSPEVSQGKED